MRFPLSAFIGPTLLKIRISDASLKETSDNIKRKNAQQSAPTDPGNSRRFAMKGHSNHLTVHLLFTGASSVFNEVAETLSCLVF
jgi:hypothetical protein